MPDSERGHEHPVDPARVQVARARLIGMEDAGRLAGVLGLIADPVRSRILFALADVEELCVGDLALALEVKEDSISYGLRLLRTAGLVRFRREGRVIYYSLAEGFPRRLLQHCLNDLLGIEQEGRSGDGSS